MCTELLIVALFVIGTEWKQPKCPSLEDWFTKLCNSRQPIKKMRQIFMYRYESASR